MGCAYKHRYISEPLIWSRNISKIEREGERERESGLIVKLAEIRVFYLAHGEEKHLRTFASKRKCSPRQPKTLAC